MTGAYELLKEHKTEFKITVYVIMQCANVDPATQSRDKFATITEEKDLEDDSANFTMTICCWSCIIAYNNKI